MIGKGDSCEGMRNMFTTNGKISKGRTKLPNPWLPFRILLTVMPVLFQTQVGAQDNNVSLSFQDVEVRVVLQLLADDNHLNLVVSEAVTGSITLQLENVPWEQALQAVLQSRNLDRQLLGNVLYVAPAEEIAEREQRAASTRLLSLATAQLQTEYVQINYAEANSILALLNGDGAVAAEAPEAELEQALASAGSGILSSRGSATVDARTNTLIIRDTAAVLAEVRELLARLDVPVRQVLIEARIVNVATDVGRDLGVRWGASRGARRSASSGAANGGDDADPADGFRPHGTQAALSVDLGIQSREGTTLAIGFARNSDLIELELSALESTGQGEVIARPRITTQDKVTATIQSGVRIPYQAQAGGTAGGSTTEFVDALLSLQVTPQITPDGRIIMQLDLHQDSVAPGSGGVPAINTNSLSTRVLVANADTIVLGGVFRDETTTLETRTPILADVPYLGRLFKHSSTAQRRTELLIFITPRIITESLR